MTINDLKIALRSFRKNKFYGLINLSGLVVGMASCLLLLIYLQHELNFDTFHRDLDRIYTVGVSASFGGDEFQTTNTPPPVGETIAGEFPEVVDYTRHYFPGELVMKYEDQVFTESNVWAVDSNFLSFFSFPMSAGDRATCLQGTRSLVITEQIAEKYFGSQNALGRDIYMGDTPFTVTGILKDIPANSTLQFDMLYPLSASGRVSYFSWSWVWLQMNNYVKTDHPLTDAELAALHGKFPTLVRQHAAKAFARIGQPLDEFFAQGNKWELSLIPFGDIHLHLGEVNSRLATIGSIDDVQIFATVGLFILLLASINFMNLSTARSMKRSKEVGVRKVLGSDRGSLIRQFMLEALLYSFSAGIMALAVVQLALPWFNDLIGISLGMSALWNGWGLAALIGLPLLTGILAGMYPALYLSSFRPANALKSLNIKSKGNAGIRNGLVVFQFAISIALIIATLTVLQQLNFTLNSDLGIDREHVLVLPNTHRMENRSEAFRDELLNLPEVINATVSTDLPARGNFGDFYVPDADEGNPDIAEDITLYSYMTDEAFVPTMDIDLVAGRNFGKEYGTDSMAVILNQRAVEVIGWKDPVGKWLTYPGGGGQRFQVVGIVKDFHFGSLRFDIEPFALFHHSSKTYRLQQEFVAVRLKPDTERAFIQKAKSTWSAFAPDVPFAFTFMDEDFSSLYQAESRLGSLLTLFTFLSVFIACLGLFGLIAFATEQRRKEIGIRKVLGASVPGITGMLAKDFLKLVVIALVIASPLAWFFMENWLQDFAYRIDLEWWVFAVAGGAAVALAFLTVSFQSIKAALANPVESLRSE